MADITSICEDTKSKYSPCDVSDCLLTLKVHGAGYLADIGPIPSHLHGKNRIVAPVSTIIFVAKDHQPGKDSSIPKASNLPKDKHWTDVAPPGSVILMQQPAHQIVAVLGDIVATRYKQRGILAAVVDGRVRDNASCGDLCAEGKVFKSGRNACRRWGRVCKRDRGLRMFRSAWEGWKSILGM
ncbi:unnamed protein product [Zymoseptoria tritici ST99CH_1E4]|uniref:Uncharacterized protein n=1 Tax=Zymoseptoria tritici ST99CH_1E4 TaxID=1276532 RepID=A0A2H1GI00_ZYMTR|nr:unnamed protein product [Zymoseptoria tritici ST99CH_1E4]